MVALMCLCLFLSSCLGEELPVLYDTHIDLWVRDARGNNLLDPAVDGHFDQEAIRLYYVHVNDTTEVLHPRQDAPRNLSVLKNNSNGEFFLRLLPNEGQANDEQTITILEWRPGVKDELECLIGRSEQAVFIKKVWYNDELRFEIGSSVSVTWGDQIMGRFIELRKPG